MKKSLVAALLIAVLAIGAAACSNGKGSSDEKLTIAGIVFQEDQFMQLDMYGMKAAAEAAGVEILTANSANSIDKEIELINTYIERGVDGIVIVPLSNDASVPALKKAHDKGIKITLAGSGIKEDFYETFVENDQKELGQMTGAAAREFIEKNMGGKANIAMFAFKAALPELSDARVAGFKEEVTKLPGVKIVAEQDAWSPEMGVQKVGDVLTANPDVNLIWAANEGGTVGATMAVKNAGKQGKVFVFGTDASEQLANFTLDPDNVLQMVTGQQPYEIGKAAAEALIKSIKGEKVDKHTVIHGFKVERSDPDGAKAFIEDLKSKLK